MHSAVFAAECLAIRQLIGLLLSNSVL